MPPKKTPKKAAAASPAPRWQPCDELGLKVALGDDPVYRVLSYSQPLAKDSVTLVCKAHLLIGVHHAIGGTARFPGCGMIALLQSVPVPLVKAAVHLMGPLPALSYPTCAPG